MIKEKNRQEHLGNLLKSAYQASNGETIVVNNQDEKCLAQEINEKRFDGEIKIVTLDELGQN